MNRIGGKSKNETATRNIIDNYFFEKFDINSSYFKISYFGTPKRLKSELNKSGYDLKDSQGQWEIVLYE